METGIQATPTQVGEVVVGEEGNEVLMIQKF